MIFKIGKNKELYIINVKDEDKFLKINKKGFVKIDEVPIELDIRFLKLDENDNLIEDIDRKNIHLDKLKKEFLVDIKNYNNIPIDLQNDEECINAFKDKLIKEFADFMHIEAYKYIAEGMVTSLQKFRYEAKYEIAKAYVDGGSEFISKEEASSLLEAEANSIGMSIDNFANLIIDIAKEYKKAEYSLLMKIEWIRVSLKQFSLKNVQEFIENIKDMIIDKKTIKELEEYAKSYFNK